MLRKIWKAAATQRARSRERARLTVVAVAAGLALTGCAAPAQSSRNVMRPIRTLT